MEGLQVIDPSWRYLYLNQTAAAQGQRRVEELAGRTMMECYPGIEQTPVFQVLKRVMETRRPERLRNEFTFPGGETRWFDLVVNPVPDGICVLSLDVTEQRQTELELHHAQRMEVVGQLSGGIAHDFNNQLTAILGFAELLLARQLDESTRQDLQGIIDAVRRSASLTRQLLAFSRRQMLRVEPLDLNDVVWRVGALLQRLLGEHITCDLDLAPGPPLVMADAQQLENALTNLAVNARDAMPAGGRLTIRTAAVEFSAEDSRQHPAMRPGAYTVLTVADTGHGMDESTQRRIFEPFFTTKELGQGTGLGLAMVYGLVKQMGGFIWVYSEPGRGTTFRLYFPVTAAPRREPPETARRRPRPPGHATVLVVEDDADVRELIIRALSSHGYKALAASNAEEARRHLAAVGDVDVVLTDVVLPEVGGPELMKELSISPARVVFMSGYLDKHITLSPAGSANLLEKPFTIREMVDAVENALAAAASSPGVEFRNGSGC